MAESPKITDRAAEIVTQAAAAAGPIAAQARDRATALAGQAAAAAGPIVEQARVRAAQGVDVLAGNLDKISGGKYSQHIHSVASKVEEVLDGKAKPPAHGVDPLKTEADPLRQETEPLNQETEPLKQQTAPAQQEATPLQQETTSLPQETAPPAQDPDPSDPS